MRAVKYTAARLTASPGRRTRVDEQILHLLRCENEEPEPSAVSPGGGTGQRSKDQLSDLLLLSSVGVSCVQTCDFPGSRSAASRWFAMALSERTSAVTLLACNNQQLAGRYLPIGGLVHDQPHLTSITPGVRNARASKPRRSEAFR